MFNSGRVNLSLDILGVHLHTRNFNLKIWLLVSFLNQIAVFLKKNTESLLLNYNMHSERFTSLNHQVTNSELTK